MKCIKLLNEFQMISFFALFEKFTNADQIFGRLIQECILQMDIDQNTLGVYLVIQIHLSNFFDNVNNSYKYNENIKCDHLRLVHLEDMLLPN